MLLNYIFAHNRMTRVQNGEEVPDEDMRYEQLKRIEPIIEEKFKIGEMDFEQYKKFKEAIAEYETQY